MKKLVIITNIPSPYRVDFFYYLQENIRDYEIHILYASRNEDNRAWKIDESKMRNSHFLDSWTLTIPRQDILSHTAAEFSGSMTPENYFCAFFFALFSRLRYPRYFWD